MESESIPKFALEFVAKIASGVITRTLNHRLRLYGDQDDFVQDDFVHVVTTNKPESSQFFFATHVGRQDPMPDGEDALLLTPVFYPSR